MGLGVLTRPTPPPSEAFLRTPRLQVVSGYVGNKSAIFPMQLLGLDVDPIYTVQVGGGPPLLRSGFAFVQQGAAQTIAQLAAADVLLVIFLQFSNHTGFPLFKGTVRGPAAWRYSACGAGRARRCVLNAAATDSLMPAC